MSHNSGGSFQIKYTFMILNRDSRGLYYLFKTKEDCT